MSRTRPCSAASQAERKANRCCRSPRPRRKHDRAGAITRGLGPASKESAFRAQHVAGDDELLDLARALIEAEEANVTIEALDAEIRDVARAAMDLHGAIG